MNGKMAVGAACALWTLAQGAARADSEAPITAVVLYPGLAMVERSAGVKEGATHVELAGLPANFDLQSLRVAASAGIQVGQIVTHDLPRGEAATPREAALEAKIQALQDNRTSINLDARAAAVVQAYLERLGGAGDKSVPADGKAMAGVIDAIHHGAHDSLAQMQRADIASRDIDRQIAALQRELDQVKSGVRAVRSIDVSVAARQAGQLKISYQVRGAGWKPAYRASLDTRASTVEVERYAVVSQKTGEDWTGVRLRLSTGQPRQSPLAPDPQARLLLYQPPQPPYKEEAGSLRYGTVRTPAPPAPPAPAAVPLADGRGIAAVDTDNYQPPVLETQGNFNTEFEVPTRASLPADGREIQLPLGKQTLAVRQRVRVVPRLDTGAVLTAEATRPAGVWLNGNIQLFRDGNFVGAAPWNTQENEGLVFPFGRDELIRVSVDRAKEESATTGVLTTRGRRQVADTYTITSSHAAPVELLVLEAAPVSTSDEVRVEASYAPKPGIDAWRQRRGIVGWESTIAAGATRTFKVNYQVSYPVEGQVLGLP